MSDIDKTEEEFKIWAATYLEAAHPKKHGADKMNDYHRPAVMLALALTWVEFIKPMLEKDCDAEEE